jgi:hypothetical protein
MRMICHPSPASPEERKTSFAGKNNSSSRLLFASLRATAWLWRYIRFFDDDVAIMLGQHSPTGDIHSSEAVK